MKSLNIIHLFPDLLNLYGDRGNIAVFKKRCSLRGIEPNVIPVMAEDEPDFTKADIILLGGGSDREQRLVCGRLLKYKNELTSYRDDMGCLLAVCGGYQLLGHYYFQNGEKIEGLELCGLYTEQKEGRLIGNIAVQTQNGVAVGFENHGGRTYLDKNATPFGTVIRGFGNNGEDKTEGVIFKNIIGTYLHGPLLPKNPEIADLMIRRAISRKYGEDKPLEPIDDYTADLAKSYVLDATLKK